MKRKYKEVINQKCHFCENLITGNQKYMVAGTGLGMDGRRRPKWLKDKPEFLWGWNGLSGDINGERVEFNFYLCPEHQTQEHYNRAFSWAQEEINKVKAN